MSIAVNYFSIFLTGAIPMSQFMISIHDPSLLLSHLYLLSWKLTLDLLMNYLCIGCRVFFICQHKKVTGEKFGGIYLCILDLTWYIFPNAYVLVVDRHNNFALCVYICVMLRTEPRALLLVGKHSTTEQQTTPLLVYFSTKKT